MMPATELVSTMPSPPRASSPAAPPAGRGTRGCFDLIATRASIRRTGSTSGVVVGYTRIDQRVIDLAEVGLDAIPQQGIATSPTWRRSGQAASNRSSPAASISTRTSSPTADRPASGRGRVELPDAAPATSAVRPEIQTAWTVRFRPTSTHSPRDPRAVAASSRHLCVCRCRGNGRSPSGGAEGSRRRQEEAGGEPQMPLACERS